MSAPAEVIPRPAATLLLLRDGPAGLEVLMVTRHAATEVAGGALVFPGGRVDPADGAPKALDCCGAAAQADPATMRFRVAAIRESFEEAHVLLARRRGEEAPIAAPALAALEEDLAARLGRAPHFADLMASGAIELATDLMVPFAHWITPKGRSRRFDTRFFLAPVPADQVAAHDGREAVESVWISPAAAVAAADARRVSLVFATRMNLRKLGQSRDVAAALAAARGDRIVTICPELYETPAGLRIRIPADAGYGPADMSAEDVLVTR
jgi:8-oxo-dGTP pyrophosphatase MutT (NUDIX family)